MDEARELVAQVTRGALTVEQLEQLVQDADEQLGKYAEARDVLERSGSDGWTYEVYVSLMQAVSPGESHSVGRQVWDQMFNKDQLELRASAIELIEEGQQNFRLVRSEASKQLDRQRPAAPDTGSPKRWWRQRK